MPNDSASPTVDPRINALTTYIHLLTDAWLAAEGTNATALKTQIGLAYNLRVQINAQLMAKDNKALVAAKKKVVAANATLQQFKESVKATVADVAIAGKIIGALAEIAHLVAVP
ncbi:MAG: hypothetical protein LGL72_14425 [Acidibrevibacterium sp.]|jgi:hypothetical protein|uniref:hypothetical protein n=1 Tax=Acidibrevibacterium fodinaquatile TaxID=1969806 RepID=UPI0023A8C185|nr:hypothetical protein [Acidibrevibacterium fodinaquatile]MCA7120556.1 hypothetical protein [Acidibrevibacterium fodinaquatile]